MNRKLWGIDLGGTKIEGIIIDSSAPANALHRLRLSTKAIHGYDEVVRQIVTLVEEMEKVSGFRRPEKIGLGTPGISDSKTSLLKNSNAICLNGRSLKDDVDEALGAEVIMANDANCCALASARLGAAQGCDVVLGLIIGTGVGGGIVVKNQIIDGLHGIAGEWGHNKFCGAEDLCYCGRKGCNETVFSGPALERFYHKKTGKALSLIEIVKKAEAGEEAAIQTLKRLQETFAEAIAVPINIIDPDVIVIGGGVGNIDILYTDETRALIAKHVFNNEFKTRFLKPQLGDSAGVFGAAMLTA